MLHKLLLGRQPRFVAGLLGLAVAVAACADGTGPSKDPLSPSFNETTVPPARSIVCKVGPAGSYKFTASRSETSLVTDGWSGTLLLANPFVVQAGTCVEFFEGGPTADQVWVREVELPAGVSLVKIVVELLGGDCALDEKYCPVSYTNIDQVKRDVHFAAKYRFTFYNEGEEPPPPPPPPPTGADGCTPGYWKQPQHFGNWTTFSTTDRWNTVFGRNLFQNNRTLLSALDTGGGGKNRFGRHSTAALLNAANGSVAYGMTTAQVIAAVQAAVDAGTYDQLSDRFEDLNERGCPLGRAP